jgi:chemotaxis regulatin CheY-phosphate phosphatase CheZ
MERLVQKEKVEELKAEWKRLWRERIDDKVRAEGIANNDFSMLFVDKGTVIFATRNFKMLNFREILELHKVVDIDRIIPPSPQVGGWGKFIRTVIANKNSSDRVKQTRQYLESKKQKQQLKKSGRGWLHF